MVEGNEAWDTLSTTERGRILGITRALNAGDLLNLLASIVSDRAPR